MSSTVDATVAVDEPVEQEDCGSGEPDGAEQDALIIVGPAWAWASPGEDAATIEQPVLLRNTDEDVRRNLGRDLSDRVGEGQVAGRHQLGTELGPADLLGTDGCDVAARRQPGRVNHGRGAVGCEHHHVGAGGCLFGVRRRLRRQVEIGCARSAKAFLRSALREDTRTSNRSRTAAIAQSCAAAWTPVPMTAKERASERANVSAATPPMAPTRRGPSSFPTAIARTLPSVVEDHHLLSGLDAEAVLGPVAEPLVLQRPRGGIPTGPHRERCVPAAAQTAPLNAPRSGPHASSPRRDGA